MNFVGHLVAARWFSDRPGFLLGAMLPDLHPMARLPASVQPAAGDIADGAAFHRRTDAAFHAAAGWNDLLAPALSVLAVEGLPRGFRRGVAHVGLELLLDGILAADHGVQENLASALAYGTAHLHLAEPAHDHRWAELRHQAPELVRGYADPAFVAERAARVVSRRPRLASKGDHAETLRRWAADACGLVAERSAALMDELRKALTG